MDYVQVPTAEEKVEEEPGANSNSNSNKGQEATIKGQGQGKKNEERKKRVHELMRAKTATATEEGAVVAVLAKSSGSESSLSEGENAKEASSRCQQEREECSDNESCNESANKLLPDSRAIVIRRKGRGNPLFRKSECSARADSDGTQNK